MNQIKTIKFPKGKDQYELVDENLRNQISNLNTGDSNMATMDWVNDKLSMLALAHRHNLILQETVQPTCVEDGYELYGCSCGGVHQKTILQAIGEHSYCEPYLSDEFSTGYGQKCSICGGIVELTPPTLASLSVGSSVFMNVDGVRTEFLIVQQGKPSGSWSWGDETYSYDSSCNGTWLLMKDVYPSGSIYDLYSHYYHDYRTSKIHSYLNDTFFYLLDSNIRAIVKQVKLPVEYGNTLDTKVFLPSAYELGVYEDEGSDGNPLPPISGRKLDYFLQDGYYPQSNTKADEKRKCYNNGTLAVYPTRTTWEYYSEEDDYTYYEYWCVSKTGSFTRRYSNYGTEYTETPRPAMILPSDTIVDSEFNIKAPEPKYQTVSTLEVGSSVFMNVGGARTEFLVVHQGLPSAYYYDTSCNGTWLLMKNIYEKRSWDPGVYDYANSDIHSYLNNAFINLLDTNIKNAVKTVKLPYVNGKEQFISGSSGLPTNVFLLSCAEIGYDKYWSYDEEDGTYQIMEEGSTLKYFVGLSTKDRIAYFNGSATKWWLRSPYTQESDGSDMWVWVHSNNTYSSIHADTVYTANGIRPALILPSDVLVDGEFNVIA